MGLALVGTECAFDEDALVTMGAGVRRDIVDRGGDGGSLVHEEAVLADDDRQPQLPKPLCQRRLVAHHEEISARRTAALGLNLEQLDA